jgi:electron transfer flavoprotein beta subunit
MEVIVCIKKVPEIDQVSVKDERVVASGTGMTNPFDMYAIEEAIRIKEKTGGEVKALTFGPEDSEFALREALSLGADTAMRIWDEQASGGDIISTAKMLAAGIKKAGNAGIAIFGKQAVDDDASAVAGAVAGYLGWPQILFVKKIREISDEKIIAERATETGFDVVESSLPVVISVVKEINEPRLPSLKGKMKAKKTPIEIWSLADIGIESSSVGAESTSSQIKAEQPPSRPKGEIISGETPDEIANSLVRKLKEAKII